MKFLAQKLFVHVSPVGRTSPSPVVPKSAYSSDGPATPPVLLLACSTMSLEHSKIINGRRLCEDRKTVFEHLYPDRFFKSTVKLTMMQSMHLLSGYINDQLKVDTERDELVNSKVISQQQADKEADEWSEREWKKRWEEYPKQLAIAFAKYHAVVFVTRFYEYVAEKWVSEVTLDKLTMDTFACAKRTEKAGKMRLEMGHEMFATCWNANVIAFLADYSVHQIILLFGYYVYMREHRQQRRLKRLREEGHTKESDETEIGALALSVFRKSSLLVISRAVALFFTSVGGAIGTVVRPGYGTLIFANLGDGLAATLTEGLVDSPVV